MFYKPLFNTFLFGFLCLFFYFFIFLKSGNALAPPFSKVEFREQQQQP